MRLFSLGGFLVSLAAFTMQGCPPSPTPPPPDASDAAPRPTGDSGIAVVCTTACAQLELLGCKEGVDTSCADRCVYAQTSRITDLKPDCLAKARTKGEARACGSVACP